MPDRAPPLSRARFAALAFAGLALPALSAPAGNDADARCKQAKFLRENAAAMERMMADMDVAPSGDVDRDFVAMMAPHHQGAIDMAESVLRYGRNERIRRIAQEIIVTQQQEIVAMRMAVGLDGGAGAHPRGGLPHRHAANGTASTPMEDCP